MKSSAGQDRRLKGPLKEEWQDQALNKPTLRTLKLYVVLKYCKAHLHWTVHFQIHVTYQTQITIRQIKRDMREISPSVCINCVHSNSETCFILQACYTLEALAALSYSQYLKHRVCNTFTIVSLSSVIFSPCDWKIVSSNPHLSHTKDSRNWTK